MKILILALLTAATAFATQVSAAPLCERLFTEHHEYLQRLWEVTEHEGTEPIVEVDSYPERQPGQRPRRHSGQWWWTHHTLKHHQFPDDRSRTEWTMSNIRSDDFYKKVYGQYQDIIANGTIQALREVDSTIEIDRTTYAEVRTATHVIGTWRWFRARLPEYAFPNDTIAELPYVRVNRARGFTRELAVTKKLNEIMKQGFSVVEIGKLSLDGSPELRKRAMETIELGWLRRANEEDVYVAHVTSAAHIRLYKKYGFEVAERFDVNGNPEAILWVRGYDFMRAIEDLHHIQRSNSIEPTSWPLKPILPTEHGLRRPVDEKFNKRPFQ